MKEGIYKVPTRKLLMAFILNGPSSETDLWYILSQKVAHFDITHLCTKSVLAESVHISCQTQIRTEKGDSEVIWTPTINLNRGEFG